MAVRIGVGLGRFPFDDVAAFRRWLAACEDSPIDSIWQSDQLVAAAPTMEPMTFLSVVAGATGRLKIGTNAIVLGHRDPVVLARQCATLDHLSEGRLLPVVGVGRADSPVWKATGRSPRARGARANEALEIMTRLWAGERVDFEGEHFRVEGAICRPVPVQKPLPLWIGGSSAAAIERTVRYGTGWIGGLQTPESAKATVAAIREEAERQRRPIPGDHYGATLLYELIDGSERAAADDPAADRLRALAASGDAEAVLERIAGYVEAGITKFVAIPIARDERDFVRQTRRLAEEVVPRAAKLEAPTTPKAG
jgi:probable F420-dependent oxidoreductase